MFPYDLHCMHWIFAYGKIWRHNSLDFGVTHQDVIQVEKDGQSGIFRQLLQISSPHLPQQGSHTHFRSGYSWISYLFFLIHSLTLSVIHTYTHFLSLVLLLQSGIDFSQLLKICTMREKQDRSHTHDSSSLSSALNRACVRCVCARA